MKKIVILAVAAAMASLSQASELYWTVNNPMSVDGGTAQSWDTAKLFVNNTGYNYGGTQIDSVTAEQMTDWGTWNSDLGQYGTSAYSFYVELYNSNNESLGKSYVSTSTPQGAVSYTELANAGAIYDSGSIMNPTASAYTGFSSFTTSNVVPEPTSGLLVLFGMMALGLKRKRV